MNKQRRKALKEIYEKLVELDSLLEELTSEEEEYRDNIPENLQGSVRYEQAEENCDILLSVMESLEEAIDNLEPITD